MSDSKDLFVLVRIRKSGSQSLVEMATAALPESKIYAMPPDPPLADLGVGFFEDFRRVRRIRKRLRKLFKVSDYGTAWEIVNRDAKPRDIISGHFKYGSPALPAWDLKYITMMREPIGRIYSEYRYCRQSYFQRPAWRRLHLAERLKVAGKGEFRDYVAYLDSFGERFANPFTGYVTGDGEVADVYDFLRENYFHYGLLERMGEFASILSAKLGGDCKTVWKNRTEKSGTIDAESFDAKQMDRLLGRDLELYRRIEAE